MFDKRAYVRMASSIHSTAPVAKGEVALMAHTSKASPSAVHEMDTHSTPATTTALHPRVPVVPIATETPGGELRTHTMSDPIDGALRVRVRS